MIASTDYPWSDFMKDFWSKYFQLILSILFILLLIVTLELLDR